MFMNANIVLYKDTEGSLGVVGRYFQHLLSGANCGNEL